MKRIGLLILMGLTFLSFSMAFGQEVYKWVDERGTVHFTDDLGQVPEKYRTRIIKEKPLGEPDSSPTTSPPSMIPPKPKRENNVAPDSAPSEKDILGRGEEWWKAKMNEWNEKLMTARRSYETAYSEWKAKENELEASKFKPDSLKRKLKADIKVLEAKAKDWEKQMEEAKNMLENVLPKQARDDQANPEWLKIDK